MTFTPPREPTVDRHTLANGLRVVTVELPHLHIATLAVFVKVGSRFEGPGENGLSHFLEHMLFRGTDRYRSSYEMSFALESLGGTLDAETGRDYSAYATSLAPEHVDAAMEIFAEVLTRPRFADIELERAIILEELSQDYDERDVEINGDDIARGLLFGDHPLGQRIIGSRANIEGFTEADVRRHFERFYCARNMIVCVAGPVSADAVRAAAQAHLGGLAAGSPAVARPAVAAQDAARFSFVRDGGSQTSVNVVFRSIADEDPDYVASQALLRVLDDGMSTRLHYRLVDQKGLAYSVGAGIEPLWDVSLLELSGDTTHGKVRELVLGLLELVTELRDHDVSAAELDKVKTRYCVEHIASQDDAGVMAAWFGATALYYPPPALGARFSAMQAVTAADIRRVATRIARPHNLAVAIVGSLGAARRGELRALVADWR